MGYHRVSSLHTLIYGSIGMFSKSKALQNIPELGTKFPLSDSEKYKKLLFQQLKLLTPSNRYSGYRYTYRQGGFGREEMKSIFQRRSMKQSNNKTSYVFLMLQKMWFA